MKKFQYNWEIIGHDKQISALEDNFRDSNLAHAYLFSGPENIGKYTVAKRFAGILQCEDGGCGKCSTCLEIHKGYHADTLEIVGGDGNIKIDTVREILARLYIKPQNRHKILLVKNIERMTAVAANALLKTLEEPPPQTVFLLTTSRLHEILLTVISRVRLCQFHIVPADILLSFLHKLHSDHAMYGLEQIAAFAYGRPGKAITFLENADLLQSYQSFIQQIKHFLIHPDIIQQFSFVTEIIKKDGARTNHVLSLIKDFLDILLYVLRTQMHTEIHNAHFEKTIKTVQSMYAVEDARAMLQRNVNSRLVLENLMLAL